MLMLNVASPHRVSHLEDGVSIGRDQWHVDAMIVEMNAGNLGGRLVPGLVRTSRWAIALLTGTAEDGGRGEDGYSTACSTPLPFELG